MIQEKKDVGPMGESPRETQWAAGVVAVLRSAVGLCWKRQSEKAPRKACDEGVRQLFKQPSSEQDQDRPITTSRLSLLPSIPLLLPFSLFVETFPLPRFLFVLTDITMVTSRSVIAFHRGSRTSAGSSADTGGHECRECSPTGEVLACRHTEGHRGE